MYLIIRKPIMATPTDRMVRGMSRNIIRMNDITNVVIAVTMVPMHWFIDIPRVSTSLVTRLITSPFDDLSKYLNGMLFIFLAMSLRSIWAHLCETVAII